MLFSKILSKIKFSIPDFSGMSPKQDSNLRH